MRTGLLMATLVLAFAVNTCQRAKPAPSVIRSSGFATSPSLLATGTKVDFDKQIKPMLQSKCMPCHFPGGKVYDKLPFDKPETITKLGTKLFTRIKDEDQRRVIREFLAQQ